MPLGRQGEEFASAYLIQDGYAVLIRNFRIRGGEIDIVARKGDDLIFVEVKTRRSSAYGYPEQGVTAAKARFINRAIKEFVRKNRVSDAWYIRFDIIAIEWSIGEQTPIVRHIQNVALPT